MGTSAHTTFAAPPLTVSTSPSISTVRSAPFTVVNVPPSVSCWLLICSGSTWYVRIDVSASVSASTASRSAVGILANTSLTGAKIVKGPGLLSVSPRSAAVTAATSVDSSGLLLAAVAAGSSAMPSTLPSPLVGSEAHAGPVGSIVAPSDVIGSLVIDSLVIGCVAGAAGASAEAESSSSPPHAAATKVSAASAAKALLRTWVRRILMGRGPFEGCSRDGHWLSFDDQHDLVMSGRTVWDWFGALVGLDCASRVGRTDRDGMTARRGVPAVAPIAARCRSRARPPTRPVATRRRRSRPRPPRCRSSGPTPHRRRPSARRGSWTAREGCRSSTSA